MVNNKIVGTLVLIWLSCFSVFGQGDSIFRQSKFSIYAGFDRKSHVSHTIYRIGLPTTHLNSQVEDSTYTLKKPAGLAFGVERAFFAKTSNRTFFSGGLSCRGDVSVKEIGLTSRYNTLGYKIINEKYKRVAIWSTFKINHALNNWLISTGINWMLATYQNSFQTYADNSHSKTSFQRSKEIEAELFLTILLPLSAKKGLFLRTSGYFAEFEQTLSLGIEWRFQTPKAD